MGHDLLDDYIAYQIVMGEGDTDKKHGGSGGCLACERLMLAVPAGELAAHVAQL